MKITQNGSNTNIQLTFQNNYTVSLTTGHRVGLENSGAVWGAYWSGTNPDTVSVNEWMHNDQVAAFINHIRELEPAETTFTIQPVIAQSIMNIFGDNG